MTDTLSDAPLDLPAGSVQVLVVDWQSVSRLGVAVMLQRQPWVSRCLLAAGRDEGQRLAARHKPDLAIVDVSDAGPFVSSYTAPLRDAHPGMRVVLSTRCRSAVGLGQSGAAGFLLPGFAPEELIKTVRSALLTEGASVTSPNGATRQFSEREREVLALMSTGATNREIAAALHVGTETIKKQAGVLYRKLGVRNRTEAAQRATELLAAA